MGLAAPALLFGACTTKVEESATVESGLMIPMVGSLDLSQIRIVDTHVHPPRPVTLSESYKMWNSSFVDAMIPAYEYEGKAALREKLDSTFMQQIYNMPRQTGYNNYIARVYDVAPEISAFDGVVRAGIDRGFTNYITEILDREKISSMVLEKRDTVPERPDGPIPDGRFVWSSPIVDLIQPQWAIERGLTSIEAVSRAIADHLAACVANGCSGFKSSVAYYRPLSVNMVDKVTAHAALQLLLENPPTLFVAGRPNIPDYQETELKTAFRNYQDFLLRHIFIKAGELNTPMIIHTAVGLHPALRFEFNNPTELHRVFLDDDIKRVETKFVLIHTGYPYHQFVAAMLSQFPNVYTDLSFYSKFPGVLEETLRGFLALAPSQKIMHGSDSNNVPEEIGYCAWNVRHVLAKVLNDYHQNYGWSQRDCEVMANNVLHENAERVFEI